MSRVSKLTIPKANNFHVFSILSYYPSIHTYFLFLHDYFAFWLFFTRVCLCFYPFYINPTLLLFFFLMALNNRGWVNLPSRRLSTDKLPFNLWTVNVIDPKIINFFLYKIKFCVDGKVTCRDGFFFFHPLLPLLFLFRKKTGIKRPRHENTQ